MTNFVTATAFTAKLSSIAFGTLLYVLCDNISDFLLRYKNVKKKVISLKPT